MCLAIYRPKGRTVSREQLANGFAANADGAGFAVAVGGKVLIRKGFFDFESFYSALSEFDGVPASIHFRFATHGRKGKDNCHPFPLAGGKYALIHNGILNIQSTDDESDTAIFASRVLCPLLSSGLKPGSAALRYLVETSIGSGNKLVILDGKGAGHIFNESAGAWESGVWFSNNGHKRIKRLELLDDWDWREIEASQILHGEDGGFVAPEDVYFRKR
jgi:glutamine amidotransferase